MAIALRSPPAPDGVALEDTAHASTMQVALKPDATPNDHTGTCRRNTQNATHPTRNRAGSPAMARNPPTSRKNMGPSYSSDARAWLGFLVACAGPVSSSGRCLLAVVAG